MVKRIVAIGLLCLAAATASAEAQVRIVASVLGGYSWNEGVAGKEVHALDGNVYDKATPTSSGHFGFSIGAAEGHGEYGFLYRRQMGQLQVSGTTTTTIGDLNTDNYHGYFAYYFGDPDGKLHFYVSAGAGVTHYSKVNFTRIDGQGASLGARTQFSSTFGAGVRTWLSDNIGLRFGVQWTPVYLTIDQDDLYCDPYWGCYLTKNQFANQVDFSAGVTFRFGSK